MSNQPSAGSKTSIPALKLLQTNVLDLTETAL